jgi:hypothetical protein
LEDKCRHGEPGGPGCLLQHVLPAGRNPDLKAGGLSASSHVSTMAVRPSRRQVTTLWSSGWGPGRCTPGRSRRELRVARPGARPTDGPCGAGLPG